jgi:outer membrane lipoprotein-sorting protein
MDCRAPAFLAGLTCALWLALASAAAQESGSTVSKTPAPAPSAPATTPPAPGSVETPQDALKPAQDVSDTPEPAAPQDDAAQAPGEVNSGAADEGAGWDAAVEAAPGPTPLIGEQQDAAVQKINAYFNGISSLQGNFEQIDSNNKRTTGRFYVLRPGKLRFDYAPPSTLRIVSDGHSLAIEDSSLKTIEKYPLESTPFRLLVGEGVDLARDARVVGAEGDDGSLAVTLEDKTGQAAGQIKLYFETQPEMKLKQWVIVDAQGLSTSVTVNDVAPGRKVAADFFNATESFQPFR